MLERKTALRFIAALFVASILAMEISSPLLSATITLKYNEQLNAGFTDPSPREPVGGNNGTTLGQQRLNVFNYAASLWGKMIHSNVMIVVEASFEYLPCSSFSALLGAAGSARVFANFPKAPKREVWYPSALANALEGRDISPADADITAEFNTRLDEDPNCLGGRGWYYGLDHNAGSSIDFLNMLMHEMAHGLGIQAFIDVATGRFMAGRPGIYDYFVRDLTKDLTLPEMATDEQRRSTMINWGNVAWDGQRVTSQAWSLLNGTGPQGRVLLYAPKRHDPSAAISHWDITLWPEALMEPYLSSRLRASEDLDITLCMLQDIGWQLAVNNDCRTAEFGSPMIHVSPSVLQFGEGGIGNKHLAEAWVSNEGETLLMIDAVAADDTLITPFSIHSQTCSEAILAPGNSCTITVEFQPRSKGTFDDGFDIKSNDPNTPTLGISVTGRGAISRGGGSGGGCTLRQDAASDPLFTWLMLFSLIYLLLQKPLEAVLKPLSWHDTAL